MRYRVVGILALAAGCAAAPVTPSPLQTMGAAPVKLQYRGAHRGAHAPWVYVAHVEIERSASDPAWRQTLKVEHVSGAKAPRSVEAIDFVARELDRLVLTVPLEVGYKGDIELPAGAGKLRPFALEVQREERVRVPAGEFDALRVVITPRDGDQRFSATYHVQSAAPRIVLRKEYVVNPARAGDPSWSLGIEELDSVAGLASAYPAK